jgi:hypothetical protein
MAETMRPEIEMVRRSILPGLVAVPLAAAIGWSLGGTDVAASAALGVAVLVLNFAANGLSLAAASRVSITAVHGVALLGPVVRLGVIVALLFLLDGTAWFSPAAFGVAVVPGTLALLAYEARLASRGLGGALQVPADPVALRAADALRAGEV